MSWWSKKPEPEVRPEPVQRIPNADSTWAHSRKSCCAHCGKLGAGPNHILCVPCETALAELHRRSAEKLKRQRAGLVVDPWPRPAEGGAAGAGTEGAA